jgi:hypothetical protein
VRLEQILHIRNFWKRHLTNADEDTFYRSYQTLTADYRPKGWIANLKEKASLSAYWLGYYCMVFPSSICLADGEAEYLAIYGQHVSILSPLV